MLKLIMYKSWLVTELVMIISSINPGGFIITTSLFITYISKTSKNSCHLPVGTLVTLAEVDVPSMSTNGPYSKDNTMNTTYIMQPGVFTHRS